MIILRRRKILSIHILGYNQKDIDYNNMLMDMQTKILNSCKIPKQFFN